MLDVDPGGWSLWLIKSADSPKAANQNGESEQISDSTAAAPGARYLLTTIKPSINLNLHKRHNTSIISDPEVLK